MRACPGCEESTRHRGFSLPELLVATSIFLLLSALAFSLTRNATERGTNFPTHLRRKQTALLAMPAKPKPQTNNTNMLNQRGVVWKKHMYEERSIL